MEELVYTVSASPTDRYVYIPESYLGKMITGFALDDTGFEIHFKDNSRLIFEEHTSTDYTFAAEEEDIMYYVGTSFYGCQMSVSGDHWKIDVKTSWGSLNVRVYGAMDVRCEELK